MAGANKDWFKRLVLLKLETTEGTDAAPTAVADAIRVLNLTPTFMDAEVKSRNIDKSYFGANPVGLSAIKRGATFDMEVHGAGTATGIPPWMKAFRPAGFGAPTVGASSVTLAPISDTIPSATLYQSMDDLLMAAIGCRASVGFSIEDDEFPLFSFNYLGRAATTLASQTAQGTPTLTNYTTPVLASTENTTFTFGGYAAALRRWEMNSNSDLEYRSLINPQDRVAYRNRGWAGTILIEVPDLTTKDYFANVRPGTTQAAQAVHGTAAGNIVQVDTPLLQISGNVDLSEEQGKVMASFPVTALPSATGNDEILFTSK